MIAGKTGNGPPVPFCLLVGLEDGDELAATLHSHAETPALLGLGRIDQAFQSSQGLLMSRLN